MRGLLFATFCFFLGCSPPAPRTFVSKHSPDGKCLAELAESFSGGMGNGDRHVEVRLSSPNAIHSQAETIFKSPDVGGPTERLLWSKDNRYLLVVGKVGGLSVGPGAVSDTGDVLYLLYDLEKRDLRCNETQLNVPMKSFDFRDLAGIDFGEAFRPKKQNRLVDQE
jgi:hypothetical protein